MNNINDPKPSQKVFLLTLLGILLVGLPLTIMALQSQQVFKQFAWSTSQSATAICSEEDGKAAIQVNFTNTEGTKSMDVTAKDTITGQTANLGTVMPGKTVTEIINTDLTSLKAGSVIFSLKWTDGTAGTDSRNATYDKVENCSGQTNEDTKLFCIDNPDITEGSCTWDRLEDANGYDVKIRNNETGEIIKQESLSKDTTEIKFSMIPGISYRCTVNAINTCGPGPERDIDKTCEPVQVPTPTTPLVCPTEPDKYGECSWDILDGAEEYKVIVKEEETGKIIKEETVKNPTTKLNFTAQPEKRYICTVIAINECGESKPKESPPVACVEPSPTPTTTPLPSATPLPSPTNTPTPLPSPTPLPTATPRPQPTPTPIIIVRTPQNVAPPQQVVQPPQIIQQPGQVIQQPPQVIQQPPQVVQQPPQVIQQPPQVITQPPQVITQPPVVQQTTPAPTIKPTGSLSNSLILVSVTSVLLVVGSVFFFLL